MKAEALRAKSADELKALVMELRQEQMTLRFQAAGAQLEKTSKLREVRRDIARAKTLISEAARGVQAPAAKATKAPKAAAPKKAPAKAAAKKAAPKADKE